MIQFNARNEHLRILIYGATDDLYQKNVRFSKLKLFFSICSIIRLSTVCMFAYLMQEKLIIWDTYIILYT